jgi:hypothetical protein
MRKHLEKTDPNSCFNRALDEELVFTLLSRDAAAPAAIEAWITERLRLGLNMPYDSQIVRALSDVTCMRAERPLVRKWLAEVKK